MAPRRALLPLLAAAVAVAALTLGGSPAARGDEVDDFVEEYVASLRGNALASGDAGAAEEVIAEAIRQRGTGKGRGDITPEGSHVHHLWTTPVYVTNMAEFGVNVTEFTAAIARHVLHHYIKFIEGEDGDAHANLRRILDGHDGESVTEAWNNGFWAWQQNSGWEKTISALPEVQQLMDMMNEAVDTYLGELGVPHDVVTGRSRVPDAWATVHSRSIYHARHHHEGALAAAVAFLAVPPNAGPLTFYDSRAGGLPPFGHDVALHPKVGGIVVFPAHVQHQVMPTAGNAVRMSIAVNYAGKWKTTSNTHVTVSAAEHTAYNAKRFNEEGSDWRKRAVPTSRQVAPSGEDDARAVPRGSVYHSEADAERYGVRAGGIDLDARDFQAADDEDEDGDYDDDYDGGDYDDYDGGDYADEIEGAKGGEADDEEDEFDNRRGVASSSGYAQYLDDDDDDDDDDDTAGVAKKNPRSVYAYDPDMDMDDDADMDEFVEYRRSQKGKARKGNKGKAGKKKKKKAAKKSSKAGKKKKNQQQQQQDVDLAFATGNGEHATADEVDALVEALRQRREAAAKKAGRA